MYGHRLTPRCSTCPPEDARDAVVKTDDGALLCAVHAIESIPALTGVTR